MERVLVIRPFMGICHMGVCAVKDATDDEVLDVCNRDNPSGTQNGWSSVIRETEPDEKMRPITCSDDPERLHLIVVC